MSVKRHRVRRRKTRNGDGKKLIIPMHDCDRGENSPPSISYVLSALEFVLGLFVSLVVYSTKIARLTVACRMYDRSTSCTAARKQAEYSTVGTVFPRVRTMRGSCVRACNERVSALKQGWNHFETPMPRHRPNQKPTLHWLALPVASPTVPVTVKFKH